ncbi:MAG: DUF3800 domain-containing protein [Candidatus Obscuribacterales bacterium]|mgnify:CR=1 FL=1|jgi:hypothetical protein|nr:DUF3800 domain-containing protein [bacterium]
MTNYGYIDESGTKDDQEVMTVALIVLEGRFTANNIHKQVLASVYPKHAANKHDKSQNKPSLHYAHMKKEHLRSSGKILANNNIDCFASCIYHDGSEKPHAERHRIYSKLIANCVFQAIEVFDDLIINIAQQGNWQTYRVDLVNSLQLLISNVSQRGAYKKAKFEFQSAAKPGIQLADFYAGATRGHLLRHKDASLSDAYDLIAKQVRDIKIETSDQSK